MTQQYDVTPERWKEFLEDGDDEIFHRKTFTTIPATPCGGKMRVSPYSLSTGRRVCTLLTCDKCKGTVTDIDVVSLEVFYAITPEREPRYKLVLVTEGKNSFHKLVPSKTP